MRSSKRLLAASCAFCLLLGLNGTAGAEIGNVAAVNRNMDGTPPAGSRRALGIGDNVVTDERIETSNVGSGQLLFLDQTSLTVAPDTDIILDTYVYDPNKGSGEIALSLGVGALRFIGGRITKSRDAIVRTPTATVGIRGGLVHIEVDALGRTKVIHIAGETTTVMTYGDADGDGFDDGQGAGESLNGTTLSGSGETITSSASGAGLTGSTSGSDTGLAPSTSTPDAGSTDSGAPSTTTPERAASRLPTGPTIRLSRAGAVATADTGGASFNGVVTTGELAAAYRAIEVSGTGGTVEPLTAETVAGGSSEVAAINSEVQGGADLQPVSTTGESPQPAEDNWGIEAKQSQTDAGAAETLEAEDVGVSLAPPPPPPDPDGQQLPPDPDVPPDPVIPPDPPAATGIPLTAPSSAAAFFGVPANSPGSGFGRFGNITVGSLRAEAGPGRNILLPVPLDSGQLLTEHPDAAFLTPFAVGQNPASGLFEFDTTNANIDGFGIEGLGFSDFENEFHFAPFTAPNTPLGPLNGVAVFATGTPGQGQFFPDDPNIAGANTVDTYIHEFGVDVGPGFLASGPVSLIPDRIQIVGNSGLQRFAVPSTVDRLFADGRAMAGTLLFDNDNDAGARDENFSLFVAPLSSRNGEFRISGEGVGIHNSRQFDEYGFFSATYGTVEDGFGNTLFGEGGEYFALSSLQIDDAGNPVFPVSFGVDSTLANVTGGVTEFERDFLAVEFTRDPEQAEVVNDPFPLAIDPPRGAARPALDGGFATGMAVCSTGNCGESLTGQTGDFTGVYPLVSDPDGSGVSIQFSASPAGNDFNSINGGLTLSDANLSGIEIPAVITQSDVFQFRFFQGNILEETTAYIDDSRFAVQSERTSGQRVAGQDMRVGFGLASNDFIQPSGLELLFASPENLSPDFLRWGWWAAEYQPVDAETGEERTDLVPLGQFIAGQRPLVDDIPFTGTAAYDGFAVGTRADLVAGNTATVGGTFNLEYDFGNRRGEFNLTLNDLNGQPDQAFFTSVTAGNDPSFYAGDRNPVDPANGIDTNFRVEGAFFAGSDSPVQATAGTFSARDNIQQVETTGIYGSTASQISQPVP